MTVRADPPEMARGGPDLPGIDNVDPGLTQHVIGIRNRFGVDGLGEAQSLIAEEIAKFEHAYDDLEVL